ncbi:MAG: biotin/lipoyl-binding protein [Spirochaetes bacterium]|nr:biotin/lipoyl-binding protein [Spirochaetota bacterium]
MAKKNVEVMVTAFRDGFQSVYGARVFTDDFLPAVEASVNAGINHFEAGGGARFQSLYFYCNEDAFTMMDRFRETAGPKANLQTLARGVNVVGLDSQSRDIIKMHAELFKKHGITTIRNFDALNDVNNLIYSGQCIHDAGLKHEVVVTLMSLPPGTPGAEKAHTPEFYAQTLREILDAGIPYDSVCFKDASGTSTPTTVYETIKKAKEMLPEGTHIRFHSHDTAGTCVSQYMAALQGGANGLDLSMAPVSGGTCQSDVISMWHALRGTEWDLGIDIDKMREAEEVFKDCMKDYFMPPEAKAVEPLIPFSPMPGGALTANTQMLRDNNIMDKYPEIIKNMKEVVQLGGFGTSVTPVSQFYFQQAFNNTIFGPWSKIAEGYGKMVLGYFGKTPIAPDAKIIKIASEQLGLEPTTELVVDINDRDETKGVASATKRLEEAGLPVTDENIFISATCKEKGIQFLKGEAKSGVRKNAAKSEGASGNEFTVTVNNKPYGVVLADGKATVNGKSYNVDVKEGIDADASKNTGSKTATTESEDSVAIKAPLPGAVFKLVAGVGDHVAEGDVILILEAMKMETEIKSPVDGHVSQISVAAGDQVTAGQLLATIN